jgi:hypothetical protein
MRRQYITSIFRLVCLTVVATTMVSAQSTRRFVIQIPFQFVIAGRTLPAGKYAVERSDPTKPNVLTLKNTETGVVRLFITQHVEKDDTAKRSCLIFKLRNREAHLFQLWTLGYKDGHQMPLADVDERYDRRGTGSRLVTVRVDDNRP